MSLKQFIYHKCVGAPTYFDVLPVDVIRTAIMPFLGWEDCIHLNMLTPPGDRVAPNRIPKQKILENQMKISCKSVFPFLHDAINLHNSRNFHQRHHRRRGPTEIEVTTRMLSLFDKLMDPHHVILIKHSNYFRERVIDNIKEYSDPQNISKIPRIALRNRMKDTVARLTDLVASNPFDGSVSEKPFLPAKVWQNETDLYYASGCGPHFVMRRQGDIYVTKE